MDLVQSVIPPDSQDDLEAGLLHAQAKLHALGITAWQDAIVRPIDHAAYLAVAGSRRAHRPGRRGAVVGVGLGRARRATAPRAPARPDRSAGTGARSVKIMVDGVLETFTGAMLEPYLAPDGGPTDRIGILFVDPDRLRRVTALLDAADFQVHFHAIGDRAVREALDAVEVARAANGPTDGRHHISHIQVIHPDDIAAVRSTRCRRQRPAVLGRLRDHPGRC